MAENLESLFEVDGRSIVKNSIHPVGPTVALTRMIVVAYDPETERSTWLAPLSDQPQNDSKVMRTEMYTPNFRNRIAASDKHFLEYSGQIWPGTIPVSDLTPEQRAIFEDWDGECEKAGYGGYKI